MRWGRPPQVNESPDDALKLHFSFGARTVAILDILYALFYVWAAAGLFEKDETKRKAFPWLRLLRILRGEVRGVIQGLRRLGSTARLTGRVARELSRICVDTWKRTRIACVTTSICVAAIRLLRA